MTRASAFLDEDRFDAALAWHVRLEDETTEQSWQEFTAWLEADPRHRPLFDRVDALAVEAAAAATALATHETVDTVTFRRPIPVRRRAAGFWGAAVALAAAVAIAFIAQPWRASVPAEQTYATKVGEHQDVTLADGSLVHLNTNTALTVTFGRDRRDVRLDRGEALFEVTPDASRPFIVAVGPKRARVVGTVFNVLRHDGRVVVSVENGRVQVSHGEGTAQAVALEPGERYIAAENAPAYQVVRVDPAVVGFWRDGRVVFEDAPLSQVASELNRYFAQPIVIPDTAVQNMRFSGVLRIDEEPAVMRRLAAFLPITVHTEADRVVLLPSSGSN